MIKLYKQKKWEMKRQNVLRRDDFLCQECKRYGKRVNAKTVHHVNPAMEVPERFYDSDNLITLCEACHNRMHDRNTDGLSIQGEHLRERIERKNKEKRR